MPFLNSKLLKIDPFYFLIFLIPLIFLIFNPNIYYGNAGIDSWLYFGYYNDYPQYLKLFPYSYAYYHGRLAHIFPGYLFYKLFPMTIAGVILHISFFISFLSFFYTIIKSSISRRTGIILTIAISSYPIIIVSFSDDYPVFSTITYSMISIYFIAKAYYLDSSDSHRKFLIFLAGIFMALIIHSQIVSIPYTSGLYISLLLVYHIKNKFINFIKDSLYCLSGALLVTLIMCILNYLNGGDFIFFIRTIQFAPLSKSITFTHWSPFTVSRYLWFFSIFYFVISLFSLIRLVRERKQLSSFKIAIYSGMVLNTILVLSSSFISMITFAMDFYTALLIPQFFIVFACLISEPLERLSLKKIYLFTFFLVIASIFSSLFLTSFIENLYDQLFFSQKFPENICNRNLLIFDLILIPFLIIPLIYKRTMFIFMIPIVFFGLNFSKIKLFTFLNKPVYNDIISNYKDFKKIDSAGYTFLWYDIDNIPARALASIYLYNYRTAGYKLPAIGFFSLGGASDNTVFSNQQICIVIDHHVKDKKLLLETARNNLRKRGLDYDIISQCKSGNQDFYIIKVKNIYKPEDFNQKSLLFEFKNEKFCDNFSTVNYGYRKYLLKLPFPDKFKPQIISEKKELYYYSPNDLDDHIASEFIVLSERNADGRMLILEVEYDNRNIPSERLDIKIQDQNYNVISEILGKYIFNSSTNSYCHILEIPEHVRAVRVNIFSRDASPSFLPSKIKLSIAEHN